MSAPLSRELKTKYSVSLRTMTIPSSQGTHEPLHMLQREDLFSHMSRSCVWYLILQQQ